MWETIISWINKISLINVVKPRRALTAYIIALKNADVDGNGELNIRELLRNTLITCKEMIFSADMTDEEIHEAITELLKKAESYR